MNINKTKKKDKKNNVNKKNSKYNQNINCNVNDNNYNDDYKNNLIRQKLDTRIFIDKQKKRFICIDDCECYGCLFYKHFNKLNNKYLLVLFIIYTLINQKYNIFITITIFNNIIVYLLLLNITLYFIFKFIISKYFFNNNFYIIYENTLIDDTYIAGIEFNVINSIILANLSSNIIKLFSYTNNVKLIILIYFIQLKFNQKINNYIFKLHINNFNDKYFNIYTMTFIYLYILTSFTNNLIFIIIIYKFSYKYYYISYLFNHLFNLYYTCINIFKNIINIDIVLQNYHFLQIQYFDNFISLPLLFN